MPAEMAIEGARVKLWWRGASKKCHYCNSNEHLIRNCENYKEKKEKKRKEERRNRGEKNIENTLDTYQNENSVEAPMKSASGIKNIKEKENINWNTKNNTSKSRTPENYDENPQ